MRHFLFFLRAWLKLSALNTLWGIAAGSLSYLLFVHTREAADVFWKAIIVFYAGTMMLCLLRAVVLALENHRIETRGRNSVPGALESALRYFVLNRAKAEIQE